MYGVILAPTGLAFFGVALLAGVSMCAVYAFVLWGTIGIAGYSAVYTVSDLGGHRTCLCVV